MIRIRKSKERGEVDHGWLLARHSFSFGDYHDPENMGFRVLRVINEDRVMPDNGFGTHPHRDMEILTYILEGSLEHKDSMGNGSVIRPGEVQYMSAGRGVKHSEFNPSKTETVRLLQIWILPNEKGAEPRYSQKAFTESQRLGKLCWVATPDGTNGSIAIRQDARLAVTLLDAGKSVSTELEKGRHAWIQVATGEVDLNGKLLHAGDGAAVSEENELRIKGMAGRSEILVFNLP
jgi:redox-sensitive bicupin YhaK (pirin superfamily)